MLKLAVYGDGVCSMAEATALHAPALKAAVLLKR
jgi:hypothetical protein